MDNIGNDMLDATITHPETSGSITARGDGPMDMRRRDGNILGEGSAGEDNLGYPCPVCNGAYLTIRGRTQHLRIRHPDYLNATRLEADILAEETQRGLTQYQKTLIARAEAKAIVEGVVTRDINKVLYDVMSAELNVTADDMVKEQVRVRRRTKEHKEEVERFKVELSTRPSASPMEVQEAQCEISRTGVQPGRPRLRPRPSVSTMEAQAARSGNPHTGVQPEGIPPGTLHTGEEDVPQQVQPQNRPSNETSSTDNGITSTFPYESTQHFKNFFEMVGQEKLPGIWNPVDPSGVTRDPEAVDKYTQERLRQWFNWTGNCTSKARSGTSKPAPANETRAARKARLLRITQALFKKSPSKCVKQILSDTLETNADAVPKQELEGYWAETFSRVPEGVQRLDVPNKPELRLLSYPVSVSEVEKAKERLQDNSPGPDGITARSLRKVDTSALQVLFNLFLAAEYTPRWLREGVVTLVPKIPNPERPSDYRPITVTSQLLRCYHGILAQRMTVLPLLDRQKGFLPRDGIAENAWIVERLVAHAKENRRELAMVFVDVSKAFDSISHGSLEQALEYIGIPVQLRNYFKLVYAQAEIKFKGCDSLVRQKVGIRQGDPPSGPKFNSGINMAYK